MSASWRHGDDPPRPEAVGILALEVYFPTQHVRMADMEAAEGCSGKYTLGLGQESMSFCSDREDAVSLALSVTHALLEKYGIRPEEVGHLQVATESSVDRSKSIKSHLMTLFNPSSQRRSDGTSALNPSHGTSARNPSHSSSCRASNGNNGSGSDSSDSSRGGGRQTPLPAGPPAEGTDCVHACYGATAALLAAAAWVESRRWDGRLALVVAADVALYAPGSAARPTGGCGAAAFVVGPDAPLVLDPLWYGSHSEHAWDFFKPLGTLPYPAVSGPATLTQYLGAAGGCALRLAQRLSAAGQLAPGEALLPRVAHYVAHAPFSKLARKGLARMALMDELRRAAAASEGAAAEVVPEAAAAAGPRHLADEGSSARGGCAAAGCRGCSGSERAEGSEGRPQQQHQQPRCGLAEAKKRQPTQQQVSSSESHCWVQEWVQEEAERGQVPGGRGSGQGQTQGQGHAAAAAAATPDAAADAEVTVARAPVGMTDAAPPSTADADTCTSQAAVAKEDGSVGHHHHQHAPAAAAAMVVEGDEAVSKAQGAVGAVGTAKVTSLPSRGSDPAQSVRAAAEAAVAAEGLPHNSYATWRLEDKALEAALVTSTTGEWAEKAADGSWLQQQVGNSYTACVWQGLASLVWRRGDLLGGRRLLLFSFGSGTIATLLSLVPRGGGAGGGGSGREVADGGASHDSGPSDPRFTLAAMQRALDLGERLRALRVQRPVAAFNAVAAQVEASYACPVPYEPAGDVADVAGGSYYLARVDEQCRRWYERKAKV